MTPPPAIALNRFGLGARPDEPPPADPQRWLLAQFDTLRAAARAAGRPLPRTPRPGAGLARAAARGARRRRERRASWRRARRYAAQGARATTVAAVGARVGERARDARALRRAAGALLVQPLRRLGRQAAGRSVWPARFEAEAIRPHVLGRFEDMLLAVERHPAMLLYLDQARSIGPDSPRGAARRATPASARGLNENLAREILELHTLGVRSGYSAGGRHRVRPRAHRLDARRRDGPARRAGSDAGAFAFRARAARARRAHRARHAATRDGGEAQARAILHDLAAAPATARHIADQARAPLRRRRSAAGAGATASRDAFRAAAATCRPSTAR